MLWQKAVQAALVANVPVLIEGDPGIGKTSFIYQLANALECIPEVVIASLREPSDFLGLPIIDGETVRMAPPQWAQRLAKNGKRGLLVLDEITTAPLAVQAALLRVVLERVVGDLVLPPDVRIIAIANAADQINGWELSLPLSNRFVHVKAVAPDVIAWTKALQDGWKTPPALSRLSSSPETGSRARALVGGFLSTRPALMLAVPEANAKDRNAWASPRSWENASRLLAVCEGDDDLMHTMVAGTVGSGLAREFMTWKKSLDLPDPATILAKPHKFKVPDRIDKLFVILDSVSSHAVGVIERAKTDGEADDMWLRAWQVIQVVCDADQTDVALIAAKKLAGVRKEKFTMPHKTLAQFHDLLAGLE